MFLVITGLSSTGWAQPELPEYVPNELLIKFKPQVNAADIVSLKSEFDLETIKIFKKIAIHHLKFYSRLTVKQMIELLAQSPLVEFAVPNYIRYLNVLPNDPRVDELWGLHNTGQTGGTVDADIDAPEAWDIATGSPEVIVAVIDSGMDLDHEDLAANLWTNDAELGGLPGVDDDQNGYIDDVHGWDFRNNDNDPSGTGGACVGHGTHVAGTIGAEGNNGIGVAGVNWNLTIMPLRAFGPFLGIFCSGNDADIIEAILYYTDFGVRISNNSYGGGPSSLAMQEAIRASDSLFVAAAGNDGQNTDVTPHYPSSYPLDNIVSVAATDHDDLMASFSNFGNQSVDLGAPGEDILSTLLNDSYGLLSGTSMASPHVAGAAALLLADDPELTNMEIKWRLTSGIDPAGLQVLTGGRLNIYNSLMLMSEVEIAVTPAGPTAINPGDTVSYDVTVFNQGTGSKNVTASVYVRLPDGTERVLQGPITFNLAAGDSRGGTFSATVPGSAPAGSYRVIGRVSTPDNTDFDEDEVIYELGL
jgi:uncharacterized repeat protein (TIGR01451 family)